MTFAVLNLPQAVNFLHIDFIDVFLPYVAWWTLDCCEKCNKAEASVFFLKFAKILRIVLFLHFGGKSFFKNFGLVCTKPLPSDLATSKPKLRARGFIVSLFGQKGAKRGVIWGCKFTSTSAVILCTFLRVSVMGSGEKFAIFSQKFAIFKLQNCNFLHF